MILISGHTVQWNAIDLELCFGCGCNLRERINQLTSAGATLPLAGCVTVAIMGIGLQCLCMQCLLPFRHAPGICMHRTHSYPQQVSSCSPSEGVRQERREGELPLLATEFLQTLQCVSFVIENCRTRESAVSKIYGPTCNGFFIDQPRPINTSPLPSLPSHWQLNPCGLLWLVAGNG